MAQARQKTTRTVKGAKLTVYKMGKRWRWMLMRDKKIVNSGSTESESSAVRDGKGAAGVGKKPKKATKRKAAKRKATRKKTAARRPTKGRPARKAAAKKTRRNGSSEKKTIVLDEDLKLVLYEVGNRWRWMYVRKGKISNSGVEDTRAEAERKARWAAAPLLRSKQQQRAFERTPAGKERKARRAKGTPPPKGWTGRRAAGNGTRTPGKAAAAETVAKLGKAAIGSGVAANGHRGPGRKTAAKPLDKGQREKQARSVLSAALRRDK